MSSGGDIVLETRSLRTHFPIRKGLLRRQVGTVKAVDGIDLKIHANETLGLVGESGCGKSTLGHTVLRLVPPTDGQILLSGRDITQLGPRSLRPLRREVQIVFQDPFASLNPRLTAAESVGEPMGNFERLTDADRRDRVRALFAKVGLPAEAMERYPHEFSGGQRQRLGIARALSVRPRLIVADEPTSALDVSVQAQVINLMRDIQEDMGVSYMFISHDLGVIEHVSDRVAVMYLGKVVEMGGRDELFSEPLHPYTQSLLAAAPVPDPASPRRAAVVRGEVPSPADPPTGCHFHPRCPKAGPRCRTQPPLLKGEQGREVACHLFDGGVS